jgi:glycosyltransferase involved in cell wall biosynthesis
MPQQTLGVVTAVYHAVDPAQLRRALESLAEQTRPPDDVVVVEDGPIGPGLIAVLDDPPVPLRRVALPENRGSGPARQAGLRALGTRWVAIADADDVSLPDRFEVQLAHLESSGDAGVGAAMAEFSGIEDNVTATRRLPAEHDQIARRVRINNPINHPTFVADRQCVLDVGGYSDLPFLEDYDLMARLLASGARLHNLQQVLVLFRADETMYNRRTGRELGRSEWRLQRNLRAYGLVGRSRMTVNYLLRSAFRMMPRWLLVRAYDMLLRERVAGQRTPG